MSTEEIQLVTFRLGTEEYGINIMQVQEIIRLPDIVWVPKTRSFVEGVINLREQVIPVVDLAKRLGVSSEGRTDDTRVVIANIQGSLVGLVVDSVSEVMRIRKEDIEPLPEIMTASNEKGLKGIAKLDDRLIILLDLENALSDDDILKLQAAVDASSKDSHIT
jgi:purine-binding chemotaxis protein CheW